MKRFIHEGGIIIDRNSRWATMHGENIILKNAEDEHLVNLYFYFIKLGVDRYTNESDFKTRVGQMIEVIVELLEERGININSFKGPVPYEKNGIWYYNGVLATEEQILKYKLGLPVPGMECSNYNEYSELKKEADNEYNKS